MQSSHSSESSRQPSLAIGTRPLTIDDVVHVGRHGWPVALPRDDSRIAKRLQKTVDRIQKAVEDRLTVYGVNTGFGGMSGVQIAVEETVELQQNLIWFLKAGAGQPLPAEDVRGAMLLRVNSFLFGASAASWELVERIEQFLNRGVTPVVREFGSIGASGDLVPLASIAGALIGLGPEFQVEFQGRRRGSVEVLQELGLAPIQLKPKEGLALVNGTAMSTATAASCLYDARMLLAASMGAHALMIQALSGMEESFDEFIHQMKPHSGQLWAARQMRVLLSGSQLTSQTRSGTHQQADGEEGVLRRLQRNPRAMELVGDLLRDTKQQAKFEELSPAGKRALVDLVEALRKDRSHEVYDVEPIQDRYSVRCLAQFVGPIRDGLLTVISQIEQEINSASDNPLVDGQTGFIYHGGNFLAQYTAVGMDQLRYYLGLLAKHLDAQISLLVAPEFNDGLPPSLVGNMDRSVNMGFKGLQLAGNSIMPIISFLGNSIADRFPTHAEQFNQNINSQAFASANFARQSVNTFQHYMAIALMFGVQGVDLRTRLISEGKTCDATDYLSEATRSLYVAVREVVGVPPSDSRPYSFNDDQQALDEHIALLYDDIRRGTEGRIGRALTDISL